MTENKSKLPIPRVFISSTVEDLRTYREAAREAALGAQMLPVMQEYFVVAGDHPPLDAETRTAAKGRNWAWPTGRFRFFCAWPIWPGTSAAAGTDQTPRQLTTRRPGFRTFWPTTATTAAADWTRHSSAANWSRVSAPCC